MRTILTVVIAFNSLVLLSQTSADSIVTNHHKKKTSHTFYLGQPKNSKFSYGFDISAHYIIGFKNKKNKHRDVQLGYRLNTFASIVSELDNLQSFTLLYGGRRYFSTKKNNFKPYFTWHFGVEVINSENDNFFGLNNTIPLPAVDLGIYSIIGQRFDVGFTIEGTLPVAYFRIGYRLF